MNKYGIVKAEYQREPLQSERLYDVSVVDTPAYDATSIYARSLESMELELKAMELAEQEQKSRIIKNVSKLNHKFKGEEKHEFRIKTKEIESRLTEIRGLADNETDIPIFEAFGN